MTDISINDKNTIIAALLNRHDFFHSLGCRLSDHGIEEPYAEDYSESDIDSIFNKARNMQDISVLEIRKFKSFILYEVGKFNHEKKWTMQLHMGALRNNNSRMFKSLGADTGFDSIGDFSIANPLAKFLNKLDCDIAFHNNF